ncbi:oligosaccharide flippase family protein [Thermodesulfovibrionales bacterium]|nr:oligosaccharide flippase family protein [Thermodesulfovibrionales bacterium]MCL0061813.1 oligosaccharide flippase family protein [Thermodesulfovibrionales bacterium]
MSVVQVVIVGIVLFVLYRFLLNTIGIEQLGVWSVVLATTSVANIANLGLSASVVKFVAKYLARGEGQTVANVIQTSAISIGTLIGLALLIAYPFLTWLLGLIIPVENLKDALSILPYALVSLWITVIGSVFQSGLAGYQRIDIQSMILIASTSFNLILCFLLVPAYGLMGLAYAHIAQAIMLLIGSWVMLKRYLSLLPIIRFRWNYRLFKEMLGYGLNFQAISISQMLYDPITKGLLTNFGGLAMTGFYEMASRMILQLRALVVSANQVLVPVVADLQERNPDFIRNVYRQNYGLMLYLALPLYAIIIAFTPLISEIWIGYYESIFITFSILLAVGWFINTLSAPAYFSYLGIGKLKWNTLGHIAMALINVALGFIGGYIWGGLGVVIAWVLSLIVGSFIIVIPYHLTYKISLRNFLLRDNKGIAISCLVAIFLALLIYYQFNHVLATVITIGITISAFLIIIFLPLWLHPTRKYLMGLFFGGLLKRRLGDET